MKNRQVSRSPSKYISIKWLQLTTERLLPAVPQPRTSITSSQHVQHSLAYCHDNLMQHQYSFLVGRNVTAKCTIFRRSTNRHQKSWLRLLWGSSLSLDTHMWQGKLTLLLLIQTVPSQKPRSAILTKILWFSSVLGKCSDSTLKQVKIAVFHVFTSSSIFCPSTLLMSSNKPVIKQQEQLWQHRLWLIQCEAWTEKQYTHREFLCGNL
jgi:hypothetical protein